MTQKLTAAAKTWCLFSVLGSRWNAFRGGRARLAFAFGQVVVFPVAPTDPSLLGGDPAHIAPAPAHPIRLDANGKPAYLARFSDGPRRVPQARGGSQERAKKLGIGSTDQARRFLGSAPRTALLQAVPGSAPHDLLWPVVQGKFGRGFGYTRTLRTDLPHNGVDIGAPKGAVIRAVADGLVVYSDNGLRGFGNCVMILHKNGWLSLYAHSERTTVQAGYLVKRGERIALVGQTGYAWGPHLHFELRENGRLRDPERLFVGRKSDEVTGPLVTLAQASPAPSPPHRKVKAR